MPCSIQPAYTTVRSVENCWIPTSNQQTLTHPHKHNGLVIAQDADEEVALEAAEFWLAFCESELGMELLQPVMSRLIPVLMHNMVRGHTYGGGERSGWEGLCLDCAWSCCSL